MMSLADKGCGNWGTLSMFRSPVFFCLIRLITVYRLDNIPLMKFKYSALLIKMSASRQGWDVEAPIYPERPHFVQGIHQTDNQ